MASKTQFTTSDWNKIETLAESSADDFDLPVRRAGSILIGTFNICEFGNAKNRNAKAWSFLTRIADRFDLLAIQEVGDDLSAVRKLKDLLNAKLANTSKEGWSLV